MIEASKRIKSKMTLKNKFGQKKKVKSVDFACITFRNGESIPSSKVYSEYTVVEDVI